MLVVFRRCKSWLLVPARELGLDTAGLSDHPNSTKRIEWGRTSSAGILNDRNLQEQHPLVGIQKSCPQVVKETCFSLLFPVSSFFFPFFLEDIELICPFSFVRPVFPPLCPARESSVESLPPAVSTPLASPFSRLPPSQSTQSALLRPSPDPSPNPGAPIIPHVQPRLHFSGPSAGV